MANETKHYLFVEKSCLPEVNPAAVAAGVRAEIRGIELERTSWARQLADTVKSGEHVAAILPNAWIEDELNPESSEILRQSLVSGVLRIGVWGYTSGSGGKFPFLGIPTDRGPQVVSALLIHLSSASFPGVHNVLPPGSMVCSERLGSDVEIGRKLDRLINFLQERGGGLRKKTIKARLAVTVALGVAFEELGNSAKMAPPALQMGGTQERVAVSVKWKSRKGLFEDWTDLHGALEICVTAATAFWVHILPESSSVELIMLFTDDAVQFTASPFHLGVDYFTTARRQSLRGKDGLISKDDYQYGSFRSLPESAEVRQPSAPAEKEEGDGLINAFNTLLAGLPAKDQTAASAPKVTVESGPIQIELEKLKAINESLRGKITVLSKKLVEAVETAKLARTEMKRARAQADANENFKTEVNLLTQQLEGVKRRETDLLKKLNSCVEALKLYRSGNKSKDTKAAG